MKVRSIIKTVWSFISTPFWVILYLNYETLAADKGWDVLLTHAISANLSADFIRAVTEPWVAVAALGVVAFTMGLWVDSLLRAFANIKIPSRSDKLRALGQRMTQCSHTAQHVRSNSFIRTQLQVDELLAEIGDISVSLRALGVEPPSWAAGRSLDEFLFIVQKYFTFVGAIAAKGRLPETRFIAKDLLSQVTATATPSPQSPPSPEGGTPP